jgi:hypothetical protein
VDAVKVPSVLEPSDSWLWMDDNQRDLRLFLDAYGVDINDVFRIEFRKRSMSVYRYATDSGGHRSSTAED